MKCISNMFPFCLTSDDELNYLALGFYDNLADLYDNCSTLNFKPFRFTDNKKYFLIKPIQMTIYINICP